MVRVILRVPSTDLIRPLSSRPLAIRSAYRGAGAECLTCGRRSALRPRGGRRLRFLPVAAQLLEGGDGALQLLFQILLELFFLPKAIADLGPLRLHILEEGPLPLAHGLDRKDRKSTRLNSSH